MVVGDGDLRPVGRVLLQLETGPWVYASREVNDPDLDDSRPRSRKVDGQKRAGQGCASVGDTLGGGVSDQGVADLLHVIGFGGVVTLDAGTHHPVAVGE